MNPFRRLFTSLAAALIASATRCVPDDPGAVGKGCG